MASYSYVGVDKLGKKKKGSLEADDPVKARSLVKDMGLIPVELNEQNILNRDIELDLGAGVKPKEMALYCRQFSSLLKAGVTVVDALGMLVDTTNNKGLQKATKQVSTAIQKGDSLAYAMREHDRYYDNMLISMVEAGEASGTLDQSFERMGIQYEKDAKTKASVQKALIYPIIVLIVCIGAVILMLLVVIPKFAKMFMDLGTEMPKITQALVDMSAYVTEHWIIIVAILLAVSIGLFLYRRSDAGRHFFGLLGIKLPGISAFVVKTACARFSRTLATLVGSGLALVDALEIVARTMTNILFREAVVNAKDDVMRGVPLSEPLQRSGIFPNMVVHMVRIGEETGELDTMMTKLADYYDEEVDNATGTMMAIIEPAIIILLTGVVGVLLAAVLSPMLKMYNGLDTML